MQRDIDLIRLLLLKLEEHPHGHAPNQGHIELEGYSQEQIGYHWWLLLDAKLIIGGEIQGGDSPNAIPIALTSAGHDFIDSVREQTVWDRSKAAAVQSGGWTLNLLRDIAVEVLANSARLGS